MKLWDIGTGDRVCTLSGRGDALAACLSHDGRYALSGTAENSLNLWDLTSGRCIRSFMGHTNEVTSVRLSADGRYALSGSRDGTLKLWPIPTRRLLGSWCSSSLGTSGELVRAGSAYRRGVFRAQQALGRGDAREAFSLLQSARSGAFQRDPEGFSTWLCLYPRLRKGRLRDHWSRHLPASGDSCRVCLSADGRVALTMASDEKVKGFTVWDVASGQSTRLSDVDTGSQSLCLSFDGCHALSVGYTTGKLFFGTLKLWEVATGRCLREYEGHSTWIQSVDLSADGRYALSGSDDLTLKLWDVTSGACLRTLAGHTDRVASVSMTAEARYALSGSGDHTLKLWDVASGRCVRTFTGHMDRVSSVCLSADGRYAASGSKDRMVKLWDVATGECLRTFAGHADPVAAVCLSRDRRYMLSGGMDSVLKLWDLASGECLRNFIGHTGGVTSACLTADGGYVFSAGGDGLRIWSLDWELDDTEPADWDEGARPYLEVFVRAQQPYAAPLPQDRAPTDEETTRALTRSGKPVWTEADFQRLLYTLGRAGYGWLRPDGVRRELDRMAKGMASGTTT